MGARGPVPMSPSLRALRGNPGKRRLDDRPRPARAAPEPPTWLSAEAKAEWRRIVPHLERLGVVGPLDRAILAMYCDSWSRWVQAAHLVSELVVEGRTSGARNAPVKHPCWQVLRDSASLCLTLGKELGLSPATRMRMSLHDPEPEDPYLADLLTPRRPGSGLD